MRQVVEDGVGDAEDDPASRPRQDLDTRGSQQHAEGKAALAELTQALPGALQELEAALRSQIEQSTQTLRQAVAKTSGNTRESQEHRRPPT